MKFVIDGVEYFSVVSITREQVRGYLPEELDHLADDDSFMEDVVTDYANEFEVWSDGSLDSAVDLNVHAHKEAYKCGA